MLKRLISLLLIAMLCLPLPISAEEAAQTADEELKIRFTDVGKDNEAYEAVAYLAEQEIINGKSETEFYPEDSLKREEFAKILVNAFDVAENKSSKIFYDVPAGTWYAPYVLSIASSGMMQGVSENEFGAGLSLSRQDLAVILKRFLDNENIELSGGSAVVYADSADMAGYAKEAIEVICAKGVMIPRENNLWEPTAYATRAEAAMAVYNALMLRKEYNDSLGRMGPESQYFAPYDVVNEGDRIAELTPSPFDASKLPQLELAYEDFEDDDYGSLTASGFSGAVVIDKENGYESNSCVKVTNSGAGRLTYKAEPGLLQPGDWIVFTAMVKGEDISGSGNYRNLVSLYDDNNKWVTEAGTHIKKSTEWTEQTQLLMVKADANATTQSEYYSVNMTAYMNNLTGTCYFDNFKLSKVIFPPMDTVLMTPNYKGIIKGDKGVGDIALRAYINDSNGYYNLDDFKVTSQIIDTEKNVLLKSESDTVTPVMDFYFSSETLPMGGNYYLETILSWKESGEELQMRDWPLYKREADFVTKVGYDEYGRVTKNGEPVYLTGAFCGAPYEPYVKAFTESDSVEFAGHYGFGWYYKWGDDKQTTSYIETLGEHGVDMMLHTGGMWYDETSGNMHSEVIKRAKNYDEVRGLLTKIAKNFKDLPNLLCYYTYDEQNPIRMGDELAWINRILTDVDLDHPTACAMNRDYATRPGSIARTVDFIGYDVYPVTGYSNQDISTVTERLEVGKKTNPNRPIYFMPQGFWYNTRVEGDLRAPTQEEFRNMVFQAIIAGASMLETYSFNSATNTPSPGRTAEEEWKIITTVYDEVSYLEPIILSVLPAPYYKTLGGGDWLNTMSKRHDGKSYLFAVNNDKSAHLARIYLDGVTKIKGMYSKKTYTADEAGWFDIEFDKYQTEIFEYEQADYKSSHAELKRFGLSGCVTADSEGEAYFIIPEGIEKAEYKAAVSDYAKVYINGNEVQTTGTLDLADLTEITVKVVSEDGRFETEKIYKVQREPKSES